MFYFKSSKRSNNGTDVNAGQIPQLLYRIVTPENQTPNRQRDRIEPVYVLKRDFSRTVTKVIYVEILHKKNKMNKNNTIIIIFFFFLGMFSIINISPSMELEYIKSSVK